MAPGTGSPASPRAVADVIAITGLGMTYSNGYVALEDVSLRLARGEILSLIGPSGCGKSTVLNLVAGLDRPTTGTVTLFGEPVSGPSTHVGYMFQKTTLMPWRTVEQNIGLPLEIRGTGRKAAAARGREWARRVGLGGFESQYIHQLSGGMQKRVELAQILVAEPEVLLMDEPFAALDALTRYRMQQEVIALCASMNKSMVFVTHDIDEAIMMSDRIALMTAGPGSGIKAVFDVSLPRPRNLQSIKASPAAAQLVSEIWGLLERELARSERERAQ